MEYDYIFKLVLAGEFGVGKTSLVKSYVSNSFNIAERTSFGMDYYEKHLDLHGVSVKLEILDTPGNQSIVKNILPHYFRSVDAIVLVFDWTKMESFFRIPSWTAVARNCVREGEVPPFFLVGSKSDLPGREISAAGVNDTATKQGMSWYEVSARTGSGVDEMFRSIMEKLIEENLKRSRNRGLVLLDDRMSSTGYTSSGQPETFECCGRCAL